MKSASHKEDKHPEFHLDEVPRKVKFTDSSMVVGRRGWRVGDSGEQRFGAQPCDYISHNGAVRIGMVKVVN